jgi:hypothetical protein
MSHLATEDGSKALLSFPELLSELGMYLHAPYDTSSPGDTKLDSLLIAAVTIE